jgi:hypothetical protein
VHVSEIKNSGMRIISFPLRQRGIVLQLDLRNRLDKRHHHHHHQWFYSPCKEGPWQPHTVGFEILLRHSVGLLWTSDQPVAKASTYTGQDNIET